MKSLLQEMQQLAGIPVNENMGTGATIVYLNENEDVMYWRGPNFKAAYDKFVADCEGDDDGLLQALGVGADGAYGAAGHEAAAMNAAPQHPVAISNGTGYYIILPW